MAEWTFLNVLFDSLQAQSPFLGRFWVLLMLVLRMLILGTVASDMFADEQAEFTCNTLQPGCKQVCYDEAFPISMFRFWVFQIVLISTPSLIFLMYATHYKNKKTGTQKQDGTTSFKEDVHLQHLYIVNVAFRLFAEVALLFCQWCWYGFEVEAKFPCSRIPCPYTVDCYTSRPKEKTLFLRFYFAVGILSTASNFAELLLMSYKWIHDCCKSLQPSDSAESLQGLDSKEASKQETVKMLLSKKSQCGTTRKVKPTYIKGQKCSQRKCASANHTDLTAALSSCSSSHPGYL
ncbi:gap junction delta-3 protein-like [Paramormyrops kingsleyae]|uniref:gap junction delta-3 protein-like n=1 Tax=Paramormyrops kingsleyae TaxID=1676925 RepID=UPI003B97AC5B